MKKITIIFILLFSASVIGQGMIHNIDNPEALTALSPTLLKGDIVILENGTYSSDERIKFSPTTGTAANPITFRAETPGGVKFTGGLKLSIGGDHVIVDGFHWDGGFGASNFIEFRDGYDFANHSTIQNCAIDGLEIEPNELLEGLEPTDIDDSPAIVKHRWIVLYGTYNTVINCSFMNKKSAGALVLVELEYNAWAPPYNEPEDGEPDNGYQTINTRCTEVGHSILNNYFYNFEKMDDVYAAWGGSNLSNAGDSETIRVGTSEYQNVNSNTTVSNNYFVQADGENEIITNKSKGNIYTNNTFRRCRGSLVLRHGSNASVDGNYFLGENIDGTGGLRIVDSDHTITNNYIQDCITVGDNAIWNNGITFLGGGDNNGVTCGSTSVSNGYQKALNNIISNNSIVNTNAPLFFNVNTGTNNVTGIFSNNLIYFADNVTPRYTEVITGNGSGYTAFGTALTYTDNVYNETTLGTGPTTGFSLESGITANIDGEIFTFDGATGKGANTSVHVPTTDGIVGFGIGACFLDNSGASLVGDCTIEIPETLTVTSSLTINFEENSHDVSVTANVNWTAESNDDWITINISSGTGDATVSVSVTENTGIESRIGTLTFLQNSGDGNIERTLTITQEAPDLIDLYDLINTGTGMPSDKVTVHSFSKEQGPLHPSPKENYASNTLDKNLSSVWAADDDSVPSGEYKADGEYIIYDLGDTYNLDLIRLGTTDKADAFGWQIWISNTGTNKADFSMVLPESGDLLLTATDTTKFNNYELEVDARYLKVIGFGRFNSTADTRKSQWNTISEIEFYGTASSLSTQDFSADAIKLFPNPVTGGILYLSKQSNNFDELKIYDISGKTILSKRLNSALNKEEIDISSIMDGLYFVEVLKGSQKSINKIIVSK